MEERQRDQIANGILMTVPFATRDEAIDFGASVEDNLDREPVKPIAAGAQECGQWPFAEGDLVTLNESKGCFPEDADLDFGVVKNTDFDDGYAHCISRREDDTFTTTVSGSFKYAKKVGEEPSL